jgi:hypothetical protein
VVVSGHLEWWNSLSPGWMIFVEPVDVEDFSKVINVLDFKLLKLKVSVETSVVELSHKGF